MAKGALGVGLPLVIVPVLSLFMSTPRAAKQIRKPIHLSIFIAGLAKKLGYAHR